MDNESNARRGDIFISYARNDMETRKAAFERNVLNLLSQHSEEFAASQDTDRVIDAMQACADTSGIAAHDDDDAITDASDTESIDDCVRGHEVPRSDGRPRTARCAHVSTDGSILEGAHNEEALRAGRELVEMAARRPARGIWQTLAGKGGSGKTTMLLHLSLLAQQRRGMNVAVIDLDGFDQTERAYDIIFMGARRADLVFIDNAKCPRQEDQRSAWWAALQRRMSQSACVLVAMTPDGDAASQEPRRECSDTWRDTAISSFDCDFRRALIVDLCNRHQIEYGGAQISDAAVGRLAEELWGDGWQLAEGVAACSAYATVMAREPRPEEIDEIAVNVGASRRRGTSSHAPFWSALEQSRDLEPQTEQQQRDLALYITKMMTGTPLKTIAQNLDLTREVALQAIRRIECRPRRDRHPALG